MLVEKGNKKMSEDYNSLMYLEGYTPEEILSSAHKTFIREAEEREEIFDDVYLISEVKMK